MQGGTITSYKLPSLANTGILQEPLVWLRVYLCRTVEMLRHVNINNLKMTHNAF